ncbi:gibberellin 2-beta-dioxygenase 8-like [Lotus japonicus]|uniref:gibberellin 2-beta-dioxygenase 8-like n=1 Tax=Lotus japonicus TaxID=34305 RepID=UPI00258B90CB|nr:gibberellin 2-beta-dioxygenase 8-like [Lotus japonicus]
MDYEPPFMETYKTLVQKHIGDSKNDSVSVVETCELPLIDLSRLALEHPERDECMREISEAASHWGFFQGVNHGISQELLESMQYEQRKVFYQPFVNKCSESVFGLSAKTYRWGNPSATNLRQLSWSEAFHFPLTDISRMDQHMSLRSSLEAFATRMAPLAESLAEILACKVNVKSSYFPQNCLPKSSYIRLNRYPPCPISSNVYGLLPHNDTSFLTIVYQDHVGGLQLLKDGKWIGVKPNPRALVVNVGDLFQALSNDVYKSIKHRVVAAERVERFSIAFFYCPSEQAVIQSHIKPTMYRKFTLREYREQNQIDVKQTGDKVGLSRFVL